MARMCLLVSIFLWLGCTSPASAQPSSEVQWIGANAIQPHLAVNQHGVFVTFLQGGNIVVTRSTDGGRSFTDPVIAIDVNGRARGGRHRGPRIGVDGQGRLTVTAPVTFDDQEYRKRYPTSDLYFVQSADGGRNWSEPQRVNAIEKKAPEALHWMAVSSSGTAVVAWLDMRDRRRGQDIFLATIDNGKVGLNRKLAETVCECCAPGLAVDAQGACLLAYRDGVEGPSREILARFAPRGTTFQKRQQVNAVRTMEDG